MILKRAVELQPSVNKYTSEEASLQQHAISPGEWNLIKQVIKFL